MKGLYYVLINQKGDLVFKMERFTVFDTMHRLLEDSMATQHSDGLGI